MKFKEYVTISVPIAPLNEQIRIAKKLDSLLAKVDAAQAHLEQIPTLLKRFRQSVLAAATSGELTKEWRGDVKFGELVNIGSLTSDIRYGTSKKCAYDGGGTAVLRIPNIGDGYISSSDLKFASFDTNEKEKLGLNEGDLLVIRSNGSVELVGKVALVSDKDVDYLFAGYLIRLRFSNLSEVTPKYVLFCLQSPAIRHVLELNARSTSGINNINSKELAALEIHLPPLNEQKEIVRRVESLFALADVVEKQYLEAKQRIDRLTQSLLAKAYRGELVPQDPNDEPASELLKRIQAEREALAATKPVRKTRSKKTTQAKKNTKPMKLNDAPEQYLFGLLKQLGGEADANVLWKKSSLNIDDFYAKLKQEIKANNIVDDNSSPDPSLRRLKVSQAGKSQPA
ncbi:MAG: restriction endonuclease subunit S [Pseudomonadales bacterium]|nr:restriction endonuclease subunit S [Pseudomonadales bacterium]